MFSKTKRILLGGSIGRPSLTEKGSDDILFGGDDVVEPLPGEAGDGDGGGGLTAWSWLDNSGNISIQLSKD